MVQLATKLQPSALLSGVGILMCAVGAALGCLAYGRWRANEIAMRLKSPLPHSLALALLSCVVIAVRAAIGAVILASA